MLQEKANYPIRRMARLLKVSRSGYYAWEKRQLERALGNDDKHNERVDLAEKILDSWEQSDRTYGYPRITADLHEYGIDIDRKLVARIMKELGISGISPRRQRLRTPKAVEEVQTPIPDLVKREFDQGEVNKVWISDITYLHTAEGWLYLCAVRDGHSRRVLGWATDQTQTSDLVEKALRMAYTQRGGACQGVIFHADRGSQFTSGQTQKVCKELGLKPSVGKTGVCYDNAMQESFWSTLKTEYYNRNRFTTREQATKAVGRWIENNYNSRRRHSALNMLTPKEFEDFEILAKLKKQASELVSA